MSNVNLDLCMRGKSPLVAYGKRLSDALYQAVITIPIEERLGLGDV